MTDGREALLRRQFERDAAQAPRFAARMKARAQLHALGAGADPWAEDLLFAELERCAGDGVAAALADAGRALLTADREAELHAWLPRLYPQTPADAEAIAVMQGILEIRQGQNAEAARVLDRVPHPEAIALDGLALLQLGQAAQAASVLEILLAADALDEQGELEPTYLPGTMPVLSLFLTACLRASEEGLHLGHGEQARRHAEAARDALRRYVEAQLEEGPDRAAVAELLARIGS